MGGELSEKAEGKGRKADPKMTVEENISNNNLSNIN